MFWQRLTSIIAVKDGHAECYVCGVFSNDHPSLQ